MHASPHVVQARPLQVHEVGDVVSYDGDSPEPDAEASFSQLVDRHSARTLTVLSSMARVRHEQGDDTHRQRQQHEAKEGKGFYVA